MAWAVVLCASPFLIMAGVLSNLAGQPRLLWYGITTGVALLALGLYRTLGGARHG